MHFTNKNKKEIYDALNEKFGTGVADFVSDYLHSYFSCLTNKYSKMGSKTLSEEAKERWRPYIDKALSIAKKSPGFYTSGGLARKVNFHLLPSMRVKEGQFRKVIMDSEEIKPLIRIRVNRKKRID